MIKDFGTFECIATIGAMTIIPLILTLPTLATNYFGTASFLHAVYSSIIAGILFYILIRLYKNFSNKDILEVTEFSLGKFFKYFTGILIIVYLLSAATITISEFNENARIILFTETPSLYVSILFLIAVFVGSIIGLQGIFRASAIVTPFMIVGFIAMFFSLIPNIDLTNLTPIFGNGIKEVFVNGAFKISAYESLALIFLIAPNLKHFNKTAKGSFLMIAFFILTAFFLIFSIFSYPVLKDNYLPFYELTKLISYGRFIQRVESIFILLWLIATFIYLSVGISFSVLVFNKLYNVKKSNWTIFFACLIVLIMSRFLTSYIDILMIRELVSIYISPILLVAYPLIILIIGNIKLKKSKSKEKKYAH